MEPLHQGDILKIEKIKHPVLGDPISGEYPKVCVNPQTDVR